MCKIRWMKAYNWLNVRAMSGTRKSNLICPLRLYVLLQYTLNGGLLLSQIFEGDNIYIRWMIACTCFKYANKKCYLKCKSKSNLASLRAQMCSFTPSGSKLNLVQTRCRDVYKLKRTLQTSVGLRQCRVSLTRHEGKRVGAILTLIENLKPDWENIAGVFVSLIADWAAFKLIVTLVAAACRSLY